MNLQLQCKESIRCCLYRIILMGGFTQRLQGRADDRAFRTPHCVSPSYIYVAMLYIVHLQYAFLLLVMVC
jgi:hypothetical protein